MGLDEMRQAASEAARKNSSPAFTVDEIAKVLGEDADEFIACMRLVDAIIENPGVYTGVKAGLEASRLAAYRTRIGAKAQMYKSAAVGNADLRKRKDVLMTMYDSLLENINTLKGLARYEREVLS